MAHTQLTFKVIKSYWSILNSIQLNEVYILDLNFTMLSFLELINHKK